METPKSENKQPETQENTETVKTNEKMEQKKENEEDFIIDPNNFVNKGKGEIDYEKLIKKFGCYKIDQPLLDRMEKLTGVEPHRFLRRGIFFTHRSFSFILNDSKNNFNE